MQNRVAELEKERKNTEKKKKDSTIERTREGEREQGKRRKIKKKFEKFLELGSGNFSKFSFSFLLFWGSDRSESADKEETEREVRNR